MTFRTKLLLAMAFIVAGVSLAVLLVTQRRVQENYERMFRRQFERQIGYFTALQESRLGAVQEQCVKLSQSVRLISLLAEPELDAERLYQIGDDELREVREDMMNDPRGSGNPGSRRMRAAFYCFLSSDGGTISRPDNPRNRMLNQMLKRKLDSRQTFVREVLAAPETQQIGYLAVTVPTNAMNNFNVNRPGLRRASPPPREPDETGDAPTLQEVIVTKVIDPATGKTLGSLVLGFPLPELVPQPKTHGTNTASANAELIQTGILLEEKLYANTNIISESLGEAVAREVAAFIGSSQKQEADFNCVIGGAHYRVFYELMNERSAFPPAHQICLYPMEESRREQRELRWKILGSAAAALAVGLGLCLFLSHGLSAPIRELVAGTHEIQGGNLQVRVPVRSHDEVGRLAASFNEMVEGLAEKEKYRTVLNMVADEKVAQRMVAGELTLGGELREITVLFCDIRGFTAFTQNMPPEEIIEMLNEHMTALSRVVKEHNGILDKFVGDLLMAIFGAPISHGDDALDAGRCALRLHEVREELNLTSRHKLEMGIGLATGTVVAGCMGSEDRLNYTVLGERVNLASRLCSQAKAGEILVDDNSRQKFGGILSGEALGEVQLKGFSQPMQVFRLCRKQKAEGQ